MCTDCLIDQVFILWFFWQALGIKDEFHKMSLMVCIDELCGRDPTIVSNHDNLSFCGGEVKKCLSNKKLVCVTKIWNKTSGIEQHRVRHNDYVKCV